jgi:dTDP-L-rhamnose 4-epimerase
VACELARVVGREPDVETTGSYRVGDIRHCFADISRARRVLGYAPKVAFRDGLVELAAWLEGQVAIDRVGAAQQELLERGLAV